MQQELLEAYFYLKGTLKYKRIAIIVACLISVGGWVFVYFMPDKFESKARVHMDTATVLRPLMRNMAIQYDIDSIIRVMQQLMFTRPNLEQIAQLAELNKVSDKSGEHHDLIDSLKNEITIKPSTNKDIFDIAYTSKDPDSAKRVVQAVLTVFSEQTQKTTLADADTAQRFIEDQLREYETRLRNAEKAKEEFQRANAELLAGGDSGQLGVLQGLKQELQKAQTELEQAVSRRNVLGQQILGIRNSSEDWRDTEKPQYVSPEETRVEQLKDKKAELLVKFTEAHPAIKSIDKLIESLQQEERAEPIEKKGDLGPQKMSNPYVQNLQNSLDNVDADIASNHALIASVQARISKVNADWNKRLTVETEMKNLNRDYETVNAKYNEFLDRREQAQITGRIDDQTSALKFKVADPPDKPLKPSSPNRKILYSAVFVVALAVGFGLAFLIYFLRPVFMATTQLRLVTGLPVLGQISMATVEGHRITKKVDWPFWGGVVMLIIGYSGFLALELIKSS